MIKFRLFSKNSKDSHDKKLKNEAKALAAAKIGSDAVGAVFMSKLMKSKGVEDEKLLDKLKKDADNLGIKVTKSADSRGGSYMYNPFTKEESINVANNRVETLAHELGHAQHRGGRSGGKIGKVAHSLPIKLATTAGKYGVQAAGFKAGMKDENLHEKGEEVHSSKGRLTRAGLAIALAAPELIREGAASKHGLKALKNAGANKEQLKMASKELKTAYNTYLVGAAKGAVSAEGSYQAGRGFQKWRNKRKKDKESKKD